MERARVVILGGGILGGAVASALARAGESDVVILEAEELLNVHSSGRSAAYYIPMYESDAFADLAEASLPFLCDPPAGFVDHPIFVRRGAIIAAPPAGDDALVAEAARARRLGIAVRELEGSQVTELFPIARSDAIGHALFYPDAGEIDVEALAQAFVRDARRRGARLATRRRFLSARHTGGRISSVLTSAGEIACEAVVNAAGAWAGEVAIAAGASPIPVRPLRRHIICVKLPPELGSARWPFFRFPSVPLYCKSETGSLLASPMDEEPDRPGNCTTDVVQIAIAGDAVNRYTTLEVRHIMKAWAGHRTFAPDRVPLVGRDPAVPNFYWAACLGGAGVMGAPAVGRLVAAAILEMPTILPVARRIDPSRFGVPGAPPERG